MTERRHITPSEFEAMLAATEGQRHEARDYAMLLLGYRHGLRATELIRIKVSDVDLEGRSIYCRRMKRGLSTTHPLHADELRAVKQYLRQRSVKEGEALFLSERGQAMSRQQAHYLVRRYGDLAQVPVGVHPHMLRHGCGYALADRGADTRLIQDYLGHRSIQSTVIYTATNPKRFEGLWRR